jgi:hypothetical protein
VTVVNTRVNLLVVLATWATLMVHAGAAAEPDMMDCFARRLAELQPLPKVHYTWPLPTSMLTAPNRALVEFARVTHALGIRGESATAAQIDAAVQACAQAPSWAQGGKPSIAINYSPWHRRFGSSLPATDTGPTAEEETSLFRQRLTMVRDSLSAANQKRGTDVQVSAILLDCERFTVTTTNAKINEAITRKQDEIYSIAKDIFPRARVEWYGRGSVHVSSDPSKWMESRYFTLREKGDSFSCSLYEVPEDAKMREAYRRTVELARARGVADVTPWIALGAGWNQKAVRSRWEFSWDYDLKYSWQLGADVNDAGSVAGGGMWKAAKVVVLYPCPFDERSPGSFEHFLAYVRGATGQPENDHHRPPACSRQVSTSMKAVESSEGVVGGSA